MKTIKTVADPAHNLAVSVRAAIDMLEVTPHAIGETNIFGEVETAESIARTMEATRFNVAHLLKKALRQ